MYVGDGIISLYDILGARGVDVGSLFGADGFTFAEDALATPWPAAPTEAYRHAHVPEIRNQVSLMWFIYRNSLRNLRRLRTRLDRVQARLGSSP